MKWKALALLLITAIAQAEEEGGPEEQFWDALGRPTEIWICKAPHGSWSTNPVLIRLLHWGADAGFALVDAAGVENAAQYGVHGIKRRWDFDLGDDGYYDYAIVMQPNGDASYYDLSGDLEAGETRPASQFFKCKQATTY